MEMLNRSVCSGHHIRTCEVWSFVIATLARTAERRGEIWKKTGLGINLYTHFPHSYET